jgi:hypothetical protein
LPELTLYANLESHNLLNLYPASDGGILAVYNIIYGELDNNEAPGDGIRIAKFSNRGNSITFQCFIDRNNNGSRDGADTTFDDALIQTEHQQQTQEYPMDYFGELSINTDTGNYISKLVSYYQRIKYYAVFPPAHNHTFTSYGNRDTVTFRLVPRPDIQDLQITITPVNNARPGFNADYNIQARNIGTKTTYDILIKFLMDGRQQFSATDLDGYTKNNDTLAWSLDSLAPLEVFSFTISCLNVVPPGLDAGDTLDLLAFIFPMELDSFKADNIFLLRQPVVNSADPNDKLEAHGSGITTTQLAGREFLYYTIRFQNTGNDWAYQVIVKDTLSEQLDWSTFEMLNASDIYILEVKDKRFVTWYMYGIYLPDSTLDEPGSHGFISFRIKPKAGLTNSDVITNRASILFDFNEAIVTNTATTRILEERITLVKNKEIKSIKLYPSPTHDRFMMEFELKQKQNITLSVLNVSGQLIYCRPVSLESGKHSIPVDISGFSNGIYFIQLNTDSQNIYSGKVLKQ